MRSLFRKFWESTKILAIMDQHRENYQSCYFVIKLFYIFFSSNDSTIAHVFVCI